MCLKAASSNETAMSIKAYIYIYIYISFIEDQGELSIDYLHVWLSFETSIIINLENANW